MLVSWDQVSVDRVSLRWISRSVSSSDRCVSVLRPAGRRLGLLYSFRSSGVSHALLRPRRFLSTVFCFWRRRSPAPPRPARGRARGPRFPLRAFGFLVFVFVARPTAFAGSLRATTFFCRGAFRPLTALLDRNTAQPVMRRVDRGAASGSAGGERRIHTPPPRPPEIFHAQAKHGRCPRSGLWERRRTPRRRRRRHGCRRAECRAAAWMPPGGQ